MPNEINTHDRERLAEALLQLGPEPERPEELIDVAFEYFKETDVRIPGVPVAVKLSPGPVKRWWERRVQKRLIELAAWHWLRANPRKTADQLERLRRWVGLGDMDHGTFCAKLAERCAQLADRHAPLARFIRAQTAEAEFAFLPRPFLADELVQGFSVFQGQLMVSALYKKPSLAREIMKTALMGAARIVHDVLRGDASRKCRFDANLMLEFAVPEPLGSELAGATAARKLWAECEEEPHGYFVVVKSVGTPAYDGFWVPDVRPDGKPLPGAPAAFFYARPAAVHLDDLPPLPVRSAITQTRWRTYMVGDNPGSFSGTMFVSIPVFGANPQEVVAVVNVNIHDDRPWFRAYSPAWLELAGRLASSWTTTALYAYHLAEALERPELFCPSDEAFSQRLSSKAPGRLLEQDAQSDRKGKGHGES